MRDSGDLDLGHVFRVIFLQGGQILIGTAIGAGVLLLVGVLALLLSPILVPIFLYRHWRHEKRAAQAGQDVTDLTRGGGSTPSGV